MMMYLLNSENVIVGDSCDTIGLQICRMHVCIQDDDM